VSRYPSKLPSKRDIALAKAAWRAFAPDEKRDSIPPVIIPPAPIKRRQSVPSDFLTEHQEQVAVIEWWGLQGPVWGFPRKALFAIPNGQILMAHADNKQAVMGYLRAEGFRDGIPDLMLAVPFGGFHGLFIELKRAKPAPSSISEDQVEYAAMLHELGYASGIHHGSASAISAIRHYLGRG
jgi:hypothetical protein